VFGNTYENAAFRAAYRSQASYGAKSKGWSGVGSIFETFNRQPLVERAEEALEFFR
jgi:hypothetical protein